MNIVRLLSDKNPQNDVQTIQFLAKSGSPYAIELLKELAQRSKDAKMREYSQKAMLHVKKQLLADAQANKGKRQKLTDLSIHVEILMALAMVCLDDFQQSKVSKRAVARAYSMDMDLLNDSDYQDIATQVFHNSLQNVEDELQAFVKQEVKNHRTLNSKYPFYMYLIDAPVAVVFGLTLLALYEFDDTIDFIEDHVIDNDFLALNMEMVSLIAFILIALCAGRLLAIIFAQTQSKQLKGWEKEARVLAIAHLEGEIKKLSAAR
jgi:hypothetical protein